MNEKIRAIKYALYNESSETLILRIMEFMEYSSNKLVLMDDSELKSYNEFVIDLNGYLQLGDYLTATDILTYEIGPLLSKREN